MAASSYDAALARLLAHEGGYTNHPADPGGPTNFGITLADYRRYVKPAAGAADVRGMRVEEAKAIYRSKYWSALRGDDLPAGVDYAVFDYGVNSGIGRAGKVLRRVLGLPDSTHLVADEVLAALRARDPAAVVAAICDERLAFLKRLKTWPVFGKGWGRRVAEVRAAALQLAAQHRLAAPPGGAVSGKGAVPLEAGKRASTTGGIIAAGAAAAQQAQQSGARPVVLAVIVIVTAALAAAAWWWWRRRQQRRQTAPVEGEVA